MYKFLANLTFYIKIIRNVLVVLIRHPLPKLKSLGPHNANGFNGCTNLSYEGPLNPTGHGEIVAS